MGKVTEIVAIDYSSRESTAVPRGYCNRKKEEEEEGKEKGYRNSAQEKSNRITQEG